MKVMVDYEQHKFLLYSLFAVYYGIYFLLQETYLRIYQHDFSILHQVVVLVNNATNKII